MVKKIYTHIGGDRVVFVKDIVGIFNLPAKEIKTNKEFIESASSFFISGEEWMKKKSFIVTTDAVILSPISPLTLAERSKASVSS